MNDIAIQIQNISKQYQIGLLQEKHDTLRDAIVASISNIVPRKGQSNHKKKIWALKDISFDVQVGEVIGVIGKNGAGKSTLLKILSRITEPTSGRAIINGRVGSLLEVATGFHPELTGRENIYLNGAILGMSRQEINRKFDAIVDFAEIEKFLDTPVKRYSSGMYVRLAFAVAAHLEPEILLIDEVLAVGDAEFQKKCLGKMSDVAREGRTILFVSHDMSAIQRLCHRTALLETGKLKAIGETDQIVNTYFSLFTRMASPDTWIDLSGFPREGIGKALFSRMMFSSKTPQLKNRAYTSGPLEISLEIDSEQEMDINSIAFSLSDERQTTLINADTISHNQVVKLSKGKNLIRYQIPNLYLAPGNYTFSFWLANYPFEVYDWMKSVIYLEVIDNREDIPGIKADGVVVCPFTVSLI